MRICCQRNTGVIVFAVCPTLPTHFPSEHGSSGPLGALRPEKHQPSSVFKYLKIHVFMLVINN